MILAALLVLCGIADCVTTYIALQGNADEANPVVAKAFKLLGLVPGLAVMKVATTAAIIFVAHYWPWFGWLIIAGYALVLINNVRVIRKH